MFVYIIIGVIVAVPAVVAALAATKPDEFRVTRSIVIDKPAAEVFPLVNVIRNGEKWGPWFGLDPKMAIKFEGPESGAGASYSWDGNSEVGAGRCTTLETKENELVRQKLEFFKPMQGVNTVDFTFEPAGEGKTKVGWTMYGPNPFIGKIMSLFMDCDKMCGDMFTKGLTKMKSVAEGTAATTARELSAPATADTAAR